MSLLSGAFTVVFSLGASTTYAIHSQCSDGLDNDHNGKTDYPQDEGCSSLDDDYEGINTSGNFVTVTDERDTVNIGGSLVYLVTLKQQRETSRVVNVTFNLPHQANITSASDGGAVTLDTVKWTNVSVYQNVTRTLIVHVNVSPDAVAGQYLVARALVEGSEAMDTTLVQNDVPSQGADFQIGVSDAREYIWPGEQSTYTVHVKNNSLAVKQSDVHLAFPFDSYFISASNGGIRDSYNVTWKNVRLEPNEEKTFTATIQIDFTTKDKVLLRAKAYIGSAVALDQTVARIGLPYHSITTSISDNRGTAEVGQILNYAVKVTNNSDLVATNVPVDANFPIYAEFVGATEGGTWDGTNVRWLVLQIAPHDTRTLTYSFRVRRDAPINSSLTASATADGSTSRDTTRVVLQSDETGLVEKTVFFRKTSDRDEAVPGGKIRYMLTIRNTLDHVLSDATIVDRFDQQYLSLDTYENPRNLISRDAGQMVWSVPVLQPNESWQTSYVLSVDPNAPSGMELSNVASVRGSDLDNISLTEKVRTNKAGVIADFPTTGAGMDLFLALAAAGIAIITGSAQRKLAFGRMLTGMQM